MIYITGDMHGELGVNKFSSSNFPDGKNLTKNDYVIICGDFGLIWGNTAGEKYWLDWLTEKPWTTLFVDGNHENFDRLYNYPLVDKFGDKVGLISPSIYHLKRGNIYSIEERTFFTMGGAMSHDQGFRKEFISWWSQEMPNSEEYEHALSNLDKIGWKVDFVITHCCPTSIQRYINPEFLNDNLTQFLEDVGSRLDFKHWYFGHYHDDRQLSSRFSILYHNIVRIV